MTSALRGTLIANAPLNKLNTWWVGGAAKQLYKAADLADLAMFLPTLARDDQPVWLGLGSNVLIADAGINNTVILTQSAITAMQLQADDSFRLEAGVTCAKAAKFCVQHDFVQGEFFAGIPGTIGGALAMNAGAFGGETWQHVVAVETIDRTGKIRMRYPHEYQISYRSVKGPGITIGELEWFVAGHFQLPKGDGKQTQQHIKALLKKRGETQPIGLPSCGSVFKNPPGEYAARLIEACDLKACRIGGAEVSPKHANFIINIGDASAQNIFDLIVHVQTVVKEKFSIQLHAEVRLLGFGAVTLGSSE